MVVAPGQPELAPFAGLSGQIKAINYNGLALVQFAGPDQGWHNIDLGRLQFVEPGGGVAARAVLTRLRPLACAHRAPGADCAVWECWFHGGLSCTAVMAGGLNFAAANVIRQRAPPPASRGEAAPAWSISALLT